MEESVAFSNQGTILEGLLRRGEPDRAVVITHPHPLYGGDMHNSVVAALTEAYGNAGYTTLRFNFRGTGDSEGEFDHGRGEQEDVRAAMDLLLRMGASRVVLAGYSFGAWVNALISQKTTVPMVMVSPPVAFMDFSAVSAIEGLSLVVTGSDDTIAPPDSIRDHLSSWNATAPLEVIPGADHFYTGYVDRLSSLLDDHLDR